MIIILSVITLIAVFFIITGLISADKELFQVAIAAFLVIMVLGWGFIGSTLPNTYKNFHLKPNQYERVQSRKMVTYIYEDGIEGKCDNEQCFDNTNVRVTLRVHYNIYGFIVGKDIIVKPDDLP